MPPPTEVYDRIHAALLEIAGDGLILLVGREVDCGFELFEVWESKEHLDRYAAAVDAKLGR